MIGLAGILLSLVLLMYLAYRNVSVLVLAPVCAMLAVMLDGGLPILASYTQIFMASVGQFITQFFPLFLLGAIFGKLMEDSGAAARIAEVMVRAVGRQRTILAIVLSCAVLTYGGVSLFVVVFAVFPLSRTLFLQADIPRRLIPAAIGLGSFTFTMTAMPGTVQIQNQIPMAFFRTNSFAAPGLGLIASAIMLTLGMAWLNRQAAKARRNGEGFEGPRRESDREGTDTTVPMSEAGGGEATDRDWRPAWLAFLPIVCMVVMNFVFSRLVIPSWDTAFLAEEAFGRTELARVLGNWSTILSMLCALSLTIAIYFRGADRLKTSLGEGAKSSLLPVFNTACEYGYGNTIKSLAGFATIQAFVTGIAPGNPLISQAIAVNSLAGITGSASGGLSIALTALGETYYQRGLEAGIDPQLLHRVASLSCGGLDSLPHNGALITLLLICGVTHRQAYKDVAVVSILIPLAGTIAVIALGTWFGSF
ncbi:MAG: GntP family permease [Planctomycetaceae bacterium]|nr:MAG: GntP family permease [Planctomycetaceae bacterium]